MTGACRVLATGGSSTYTCPERQLNSGPGPSDVDFAKQRFGVEKRPSSKALHERSPTDGSE